MVLRCRHRHDTVAHQRAFAKDCDANIVSAMVFALPKVKHRSARVVTVYVFVILDHISGTGAVQLLPNRFLYLLTQAYALRP